MKELILNFHGVGEAPAGVDRSEAPFWIQEYDFTEMLDSIKDSAANEPRVTITFDDGFISDALIACPELAKRGMVATFFVCAGRIGKEGYVDRAGIEELLQNGMEIGSHGMNHIDWRSATDDELHTEIVVAKQQLEEIVGRPVTKAAIPFGSYDNRVLAKLQSAGFEAVFTSDGGLANNQSWLRPRYTLRASTPPRRVVETLVQREGMASGLYRSVAKLYKAMR